MKPLEDTAKELDAECERAQFPDVDDLVITQRQVPAIQEIQIIGEMQQIYHVEQGCEESDDANLQRERDTTSSHSAAGADGPDKSRESVATERPYTRKSPELKARDTHTLESRAGVRPRA